MLVLTFWARPTQSRGWWQCNGALEPCFGPALAPHSRLSTCSFQHMHALAGRGGDHETNSGWPGRLPRRPAPAGLHKGAPTTQPLLPCTCMRWRSSAGAIRHSRYWVSCRAAPRRAAPPVTACHVAAHRFTCGRRAPHAGLLTLGCLPACRVAGGRGPRPRSGAASWRRSRAAARCAAMPAWPRGRRRAHSCHGLLVSQAEHLALRRSRRRAPRTAPSGGPQAPFTAQHSTAPDSPPHFPCMPAMRPPAAQGRQRAGGVGDAGLRRPHRAAGKRQAAHNLLPPLPLLPLFVRSLLALVLACVVPSRQMLRARLRSWWRSNNHSHARPAHMQVPSLQQLIAQLNEAGACARLLPQHRH